MSKQILPETSTMKYCLYKKEMPRPNNGPEEDCVLQAQKKGSASIWLSMVMLFPRLPLIFLNLIRSFLTGFQMMLPMAGIKLTCLTWCNNSKKKFRFLLIIQKISDSITRL